MCRPLGLVVLALLLDQAFAARNTTLGFIHRLTTGGNSLGTFWQGVACAGLLAVKHANTRDASIVESFSDLTNTYAAMSTDSGTSARGTISAYRACQAAGANSIVGPALSFENEILGQLGGLDQIVNMGTWTSASGLSDQTKF
eukprot:3121474-Prymnesium_polylepis.1